LDQIPSTARPSAELPNGIELRPAAAVTAGTAGHFWSFDELFDEVLPSSFNVRDLAQRIKWFCRTLQSVAGFGPMPAVFFCALPICSDLIP
jgi:hypothetical protein